MNPGESSEYKVRLKTLQTDGKGFVTEIYVTPFLIGFVHVFFPLCLFILGTKHVAYLLTDVSSHPKIQLAEVIEK